MSLELKVQFARLVLETERIREASYDPKMSGRSRRDMPYRKNYYQAAAEAGADEQWQRAMAICLGHSGELVDWARGVLGRQTA